MVAYERAFREIAPEKLDQETVFARCVRAAKAASAADWLAEPLPAAEVEQMPARDIFDLGDRVARLYLSVTRPDPKASARPESTAAPVTTNG